MLFISCSKDETLNEPSDPTVKDPRLPNQEEFKPAIQLVPKTLTGRSAKKSTTQQRLIKEFSFDVTTDDLGNEVHNNSIDRRYSYDSKGRLHSVDRYDDDIFIRNITKFDFDDANKVVNTYYSDIDAQINESGYISKVIAPNGTITDIFYDEIGRDIKEVEVGTYTQRLQQLQPDGTYLTLAVTKPKTATYLYSYIGDKVLVNILTTQKNYSKPITIDGNISYVTKDRIVETTYELTVDYTKSGVYSSEPIFRCYIYNWMHILDWKIKSVTEGVTLYEIKYDYDYVYDTNGYLTESNLTITDINSSNKPTLTRTIYTYE
ncbi:MAG TPA: hypothetical protein VFS71_10715 [Flavobacterium sp.]|uniref:hypothetical protein n=1 Tax=Flavobacterium sp. TaxID=239 RepID=UPI002DC03A65|nr:hypothetical protein [Flavobacterium sp.]HEU4790149.1 hypothetical protein [Flavobacterium sp.]